MEKITEVRRSVSDLLMYVSWLVELNWMIIYYYYYY